MVFVDFAGMAGMSSLHAGTCQHLKNLLAWKNGPYGLQRAFLGFHATMPAMPALLKNFFVKSGGEHTAPRKEFER